MRDFQAGLITAGDFLSGAAGARGDTSEAHFLIGVEHLAAGRRDEARREFAASRSQDTVLLGMCMVSEIVLSQLDRHPVWPPR